MNTTRILLIVAAMVLAVLFLRGTRRSRDVEIRDFHWDRQGKSVEFRMQFENRLDRDIVAGIFVVAESKSDGDDGTRVRELGRTRVEIELKPRESKTVAGRLEINSPDAHMSVYPTDGYEKKLKPALEPTS